MHRRGLEKLLLTRGRCGNLKNEIGVTQIILSEPMKHILASYISSVKSEISNISNVKSEILNIFHFQAIFVIFVPKIDFCIFLSYTRFRQRVRFNCTRSSHLRSLENSGPPQSCAQDLIVQTFLKIAPKRIKERRVFCFPVREHVQKGDLCGLHIFGNIRIFHKMS